MADTKKTGSLPEPEPRRSGGCLKNLFMLALLALIVLGGLSFFTFEPQDLDDIDGYVAEASPLTPGGRNLASVLEEAVTEGREVTITEKEINDYIRRTLRFRQEGLFAKHVEMKGVWVRLENGAAEVIIEREINGQWRHTVSMFLKPKQTDGEDGKLVTSVPRSSGRFGRVRVIRGFLYLTRSSFESLASQYSNELDFVQRMFRNKVRITIGDGELKLSAPES